MQGTKASLYKNTYDCAVQIYRHEGVAAFYAGLLPRLGRVLPGQGIIFMSFEAIQSGLEDLKIFT
jgi:solute carrier family 25 citrate transporter 1